MNKIGHIAKCLIDWTWSLRKVSVPGAFSAFAFMMLFSFVGTAQAQADHPALSARHAEMDVMLSTDGESWTPLDSLSAFIDREVRPKFSTKSNMFNVYLSLRHGDEEVSRVSLTLDSQNFYLIEVNGAELPAEIEYYNNRISVDVSREMLMNLIEETAKYDFSEPLPPFKDRSYEQISEIYEKQKIAKIYEFLFSEAARFQQVEDALVHILKDNGWVEWHDYDALVHNWDNVSAYVLQNDLKEDWQVQGGFGNKLVAPVTKAQVDAYVKAIESGEAYKFRDNVPILDPAYHTGE